MLATLVLASGLPALAQESPWLVRFRAVHIDPHESSDPLFGVGPADQITLSRKTLPEIDVSYFFTPNIAAEFLFAMKQKHTMYFSGTSVGTFKHLAPTLTLQYHFMPAATFSPYLGAGINYTKISNVQLVGGAGDLDNQSVGLALQAGLDFKFDKHWSLNLDLKKIKMQSDIYLTGAKVSRVHADPLLFAVGVGYRF
ncbi:MAG TPA: OmpW family outer membrane protein [Ramlibacter sp.]|nr:OmpW family outer membrane protein [Ramlibacter sp.]